MWRANAGRLLLAGLVATLAMTAFLYVTRRLGVPALDVAALYGRLFGEAEPGGQSWWLGMIVHFTVGTVVLSMIYANWFHTAFSGPVVGRGAVYGVILWLLVELALMPLLGRGFFSSGVDNAVAAVLTALVGLLIYGTVLASTAGLTAVAYDYHAPGAVVT